MHKTTICHCGEDGYYSCVELREQLEITRNQLKERDKSIVDLYDAFLAYMKAVAPSFASEEAFAHPILVKYQEFVQEQKKVEETP